MIRLTRRQAEITALLALDPRLTYLEIGCRLGISPKTAKIHVGAVARQLGSEYPAKTAVAMYGKALAPKNPDVDRLAAVLSRVRPSLP